MTNSSEMTLEDMGCELACKYLGTSTVCCVWCPWLLFEDKCLMNSNGGLKVHYKNWKKMLKWVYEERHLDVPTLVKMFGVERSVVERIIK